MALSLQRMIADTADAMEEDGAFQGIFRFSLVECPRVRRRCSGCSIQSSVNSTLDAIDLAQRQCRAVGAWIGAEPFQHDRGADDACADRGSQSQHVVPVCLDQTFVDAARDQRRNIGAGFDAVKQVQTACGDIRDTRREPEPKQMT